MTAKKFSELAEKVRANAARQRHVATYKWELLEELSLAELRRARRRTQTAVAKSLQTTQSGVSRLEHQADLYLSTLRSYVEALGGRLEIRAVFPDAEVPVTSFGDLAKRPDSSRPVPDHRPKPRSLGIGASRRSDISRRTAEERPIPRHSR